MHFDGDEAALLASEELLPSGETENQSFAESVVNEMLEEVNLESSNREKDQQVRNELEKEQKTFKTSKITKEKSANSHWTLF